jgi:hypothetical protein
MAWGNALGGYKLQNRVGGKFASGFSGRSSTKKLLSTPYSDLSPAARRAKYLESTKREAKSKKRKGRAKKVAVTAAAIGAVGAVGFVANKRGNVTFSKGKDMGFAQGPYRSVRVAAFGRSRNVVVTKYDGATSYDIYGQSKGGSETFIRGGNLGADKIKAAAKRGKRAATQGSSGAKASGPAVNPEPAKTGATPGGAKPRAVSVGGSVRAIGTAAAAAESVATLKRQVDREGPRQNDQEGISGRSKIGKSGYQIMPGASAPSPITATHGFSGVIDTEPEREMWAMKFESDNGIGTDRMTGTELRNVLSSRSSGPSVGEFEELDKNHWEKTGTAIEKPSFDGGDDLSRPDVLELAFSDRPMTDVYGNKVTQTTRAQAARNSANRRAARARLEALPQVQSRVVALESEAIGRGRGKDPGRLLDNSFGVSSSSPAVDHLGNKIDQQREEEKAQARTAVDQKKAVEEARRLGYRNVDQLKEAVERQRRLEALFNGGEPFAKKLSDGSYLLPSRELPARISVTRGHVTDSGIQLNHPPIYDQEAFLEKMSKEEIRAIRRGTTGQERAYLNSIWSQAKAGETVDSRKAEDIVMRAMDKDHERASYGTRPRTTGRPTDSNRIVVSSSINTPENIAALQEEWGKILDPAILDREISANVLANGYIEDRDVGKMSHDSYGGSIELASYDEMTDKSEQAKKDEETSSKAKTKPRRSGVFREGDVPSMAFTKDEYRARQATKKKKQPQAGVVI